MRLCSYLITSEFEIIGFLVNFRQPSCGGGDKVDFNKASKTPVMRQRRNLCRKHFGGIISWIWTFKVTGMHTGYMFLFILNTHFRRAIVLKQNPRCSKLVEQLAFHIYHPNIFLITSILAEPFARNYVWKKTVCDCCRFPTVRWVSQSSVNLS